MKQTMRAFLKAAIAIDLLAFMAISCSQEYRQTDFVELEHQFHLMNREISKGWNSYDTRSLFRRFICRNVSEYNCRCWTERQ